ncbi:MAG: DUF2147 domain-containing protein [Bacteroidota bacterium]|nr:DUF2147 domain-containing protein [Bacteroidota bacterium]
MKKKTILLLIASVFVFFTYESTAQVSQMVGTWKTIDDETGDAKSYVKIFKATNGMYYGKITKLLQEPADKKCTECKGKYKNAPIVGMLIIQKMKVDGDELDDGTIMDPGNGKTYNCSIELDGNDKLDVRGSLDSWGIAGRTQTWHRLK